MRNAVMALTAVLGIFLFALLALVILTGTLVWMSRWAG